MELSYFKLKFTTAYSELNTNLVSASVLAHESLIAIEHMDFRAILVIAWSSKSEGNNLFDNHLISDKHYLTGCITISLPCYIGFEFVKAGQTCRSIEFLNHIEIVVV